MACASKLVVNAVFAQLFLEFVSSRAHQTHGRAVFLFVMLPRLVPHELYLAMFSPATYNA
jgi:hypothetical protein